MVLCGECYDNVYTERHTATQHHLEYNCKALFETPCIPVVSRIEP
jgi:hypothetical protein